MSETAESPKEEMQSKLSPPIPTGLLYENERCDKTSNRRGVRIVYIINEILIR